jgi:hypothetical protein
MGQMGQLVKHFRHIRYVTQKCIPCASVLSLQKERWDGAWLGPHAAKDAFRADDVYSTEQVGFIGGTL